MNRSSWVFLIIILLVGTWLRTNSLDQIPPGLYHDEAYSGLDALGIVQGAGFPIFFEGNGGREPFFIYLHALSISLFGISPFALRIPAAFIAIVTLAIFFSLVRAMAASSKNAQAVIARSALGDEAISRLERGACFAPLAMTRGESVRRWTLKTPSLVALIATAGLATSYWHLNFSRVGWRTISLPLLACLAFYFFWRARRTNRLRDHLLTGAFLGASLYTYLSARFLPIVLALFWIIEAIGMIRARSNLALWRTWLSRILVVVGAAIIVFLPLAIYFMYNPNAFLFRVSDVTLPSEGGTASALWSNAQRVAGMFYLVGDPEWRHGIARRPVLDWIIGAPFAIGLALVVWRWRKPENYFALLWLGIMLLPTVLSRDAPDTQRAIGALPAIFLLVAWGAQAIADLLTTRLRVAPVPVFAVIAAVLLLAGGAITYRDYFVIWANDRHAYDDFQGNLVDFARWVNQQTSSVALPMELYAEPTVNLMIFNHPRVTRSALQMNDVERQKIFSDAAIGVVSPDFPRGNAVLVRNDSVVLLDQPMPNNALDPTRLSPWRDKWGRPFVSLATLSDANSFLALKPDSYQPLEADFDHRLTLVGYKIPRNIMPGKPLDVVFYWSARAPTQQELNLFVHLLDSRGQVVAGANEYPANGYRLNLWQPGTTIPDLHRLATDAALAPGKYSLEVGFYRPSNGSRLPVWVDQRSAPDERVVIGPLKVAAKFDAAIQPQSKVSAQFGDAVVLSGYTLDTTQGSDAAMRLKLFWQAIRIMDRDYTVFVHLLDANGNIIAQKDQQPLSGAYPTSIWDAGENIQDEIMLPVPSNLQPGTFKLELGFYDAETGKRLSLTGAPTPSADALILQVNLTRGSK